eukprot:scaffold125248_cov63-Phaeocystis_antarctica.AAC.1
MRSAVVSAPQPAAPKSEPERKSTRNERRPPLRSARANAPRPRSPKRLLSSRRRSSDGSARRPSATESA